MISFLLSFLYFILGSILIWVVLDYFFLDSWFLYWIFWINIPILSLPKYVDIIIWCMIVIIALFLFIQWIKNEDKIFKEDIKWWKMNFFLITISQIISFIIVYLFFIKSLIYPAIWNLWNIIVVLIICVFISLRLAKYKNYIRQKQWKPYKI